MHVYAFGSVCRGEIDYGSDIDLLAIVDSFAPDLDPAKFSIYSYSHIKELWNDGNPFAWHLATEAKLLFSSTDDNVLEALGKPNPYRQVARDCQNFHRLFCVAQLALEAGTSSPVFELSTIFLGVRNFATCYALGQESICFSRFSPLRLGAKSLSISGNAFSILEKSRILSTRGHGEMIERDDVASMLQETGKIGNWMNELLEEV